jgi:hypothetical protein
MPMACPLIAASTGFRTSHAGGCRGEAVNSSLVGAANVSPPGSMSAPAQKARPAPVTTIARTPSSSSHAA